ncbi:hypothetical protein [Kribbella speibonae]|uniref:Uncharacterized protein n=1 Tax=Kribbella speibonae TaxID=1572660 RepID=A0A4R0J845_9ACTN|nr:hypothetical protein [Kribbella speibonae]TCC37585.1 hypothetical protein E0H92_13805 [Kribbella speibonae]
MRVEGGRRTVSLALFAVGLGLLVVGGFVQFNDTSGFGSDRWIYPLGLLAVVPAVAAVVVAWPEPRARLSLGIVLGVLTVAMIWQDIANDGFRFVWNQNEGELQQLELVLFVLAFVLLTTAGARLGGGRWLVRAAAYLVGTVVVTLVVTVIGMVYYGETACADDAEECLAPLAGIFWGAAAVVACLVAVLVIELILWTRRRRKAAEVTGR